MLRLARHLLGAPLALIVHHDHTPPAWDVDPAVMARFADALPGLIAACRRAVLGAQGRGGAEAELGAGDAIGAVKMARLELPAGGGPAVLCVAHARPHVWTDEEAARLGDLARCAAAACAVPFLRAEAERLRAVEARARARMEADLRERDETLTLAERSAGIGIWDVDLASGTMRGTEQFFAIMGLPATTQPVPIDRLRALRPPEDRARVVDGFRQALSEGRETYEMEYRIVRPDGRQRWIFGRGRIVRDAAGVPVRYSGIDIDITERKEAQEALLRSSERLRLAQEAAGIGTWDWDIESGTLHWSENEWRIHGREPGPEVSSFAIWQSLVHPDDRARAARVLREALSMRRDYAAEYRVQSPRRGLRWILARGTIIVDADRRPVRLVGVSVDVTDQRRAADALADLNSVLEQRVRERTAALEAEAARRMDAEARLHQAQKMEAVGQLTGGVAHDFNNLLTVIVGGAESIQRRLARGEFEPRKIGSLADNILVSARRAASLTQHLLAFSRRQPLEPKPIDVSQLAARLALLLRRTFGEAYVVACDLAEDLGTVSVDASQLEIALLNLAVNARDAMPEGGTLTIATRNLTIAGAGAADELPPGDYVEVTVRDTGMGMTPEVQARAFEPFFTTKGVGQGTGLGLSQVYGFITQSNGHVAIESAPGAGCCIRIRLPRVATPPLAAAPVPVEHALPGRGERILLVEDDPLIRARSADALHELGYAVLEAGDAASALRVLAGAPRIDLLLTDIGLPGGMNGRALAEAARRARPGLKVLFASGYATEALVHDGRLDPGVDLIAKPFGHAALAAKLREVLERGGPATASGTAAPD